MNSRVQCGLTAGVAIVGAGVMAVTPITPQVIQPPRVLEAAVELAGLSDFQNKDAQQLIQMSAQRFAEQLAQLPVVPLVAAFDVVGNDEEGLYTVVRSLIDAPLYVADPLIYAAALTLPEALGGNPAAPATSEIWSDFRDGQLYNLREELHVPFAEALGVDPNVDGNAAWDLVKGVQDSAERTVEGAALGVVGLGSIAQAVASGERDELYKAIREYIDAPLWAADPAIEGLAKALPESLGGNTDAGDAGALMHFRDTNLYGARSQVRVAVAKVLGVDNVDEHGDLSDDPGYQSPAPAGITTLTAKVSDNTSTNKPDVAKFKPHATNLSTALKKAHDQAEKRAEKAKERRVEAAKNVQQAVKSLTKKLAPKKPSVKKAEKGSSSD